jgi:thiol-disulfide isomerase/thioredoxin
MKSKTSLVVGLIAAVVICSLPAALAWKPEIGDVAAEVDTYEYVIDGSKVSLAEFRGKPVVLYFGGDWCPPCRRARPTVDQVARAYRDKGVEFIFFSSDDNRLRQAKIEEQKISGFRIAMPNHKTCPPGDCVGGTKDGGSFGRIYTFPAAFILDANGVVREKMDRGQGVINNLENAVKKILPPQ